ncbi:MAG TPA: nitroreductase family protein [Bacteroidales bacterium]|jgi:nitroreductase|nr:nitroreductase [Bacteroidales bacterium]OQB60604.1 MAG: nitroreductase A [Bacteroidetes bacterium ADurb.Bin145]HOU02473.1 nitroreductase family protein [Bacteroidales bacterium]HQG62998.1 nitroreductase family protein [Bacteroidales bacterium]HQK68701.1 nitroreductase family protein [Bacteroidales bacterium]
MRQKSFTAILLIIFSSAALLNAQSAGNNVVDHILSAYSAQMFTSDPVSDNDIDAIVKCGIKAPSARNGQPWKFTILKDPALVASAITNANPGNIVILVSAPESADQGMSYDFDCALATENMYLAAQGLGLGARIYTGPVRIINSSKKQSLGVPDGYKVISLLRVGHVSKDVDASSAASARKAKEEVVNYK